MHPNCPRSVRILGLLLVGFGLFATMCNLSGCNSGRGKFAAFQAFCDSTAGLPEASSARPEAELLYLTLMSIDKAEALANIISRAYTLFATVAGIFLLSCPWRPAPKSTGVTGVGT